MCKEWDSFAQFLEDVGPRPPGRFSLDRIDVDGNYEKENCRWADRETQDNNRQNTRLLTWKGETLSFAQWERKLGITKGNLKHRIDAGWDIEKALTPGRPRRTFCKRGHPQTNENIRINTVGARLCRECDKLRAKLRKAKIG